MNEMERFIIGVHLDSILIYGYNLNVEISKHTNDLIQKHTATLFREIMPEFYGIKIGRVKGLSKLGEQNYTTPTLL
jgi:hypothetical protein